MKTLKEKLLARERVCGTHINVPNAIYADILGGAGYDFVWVDTEHGPTSYEDLLTQITILEAKGTPALVRLSIDDYNHTKRVLEMGPAGVIFPMINTREQAERAIRSTYYRPRGNRGSGPMRAAGWGAIPLPEVKANEDNMIRCIQLETRESIDNLEDILTVEGIDCAIFGLWDMSFEFSEVGNPFTDDQMAYVKRAIDILHAHGKSVGVSTGSTDPAMLARFAALGINFISAGADFNYLYDCSRQTLATLRKVQK